MGRYMDRQNNTRTQGSTFQIASHDLVLAIAELLLVSSSSPFIGPALTLIIKRAATTGYVCVLMNRGFKADGRMNEEHG